MSLSMLVGGGAECGPSNPLQSLSKRFDQDRGVQQDFVGLARGGEVQGFRSQSQSAPLTAGLQQDAAQFFGTGSSPAHPPPQMSMTAMHMPGQMARLFDVTGLREALPHAGPSASVGPSVNIGASASFSQMSNGANAGWANDFLVHQRRPGPVHTQMQMQMQGVSGKSVEQEMMQSSTSSIGGLGIQRGGVPWSPGPTFAGYGMGVNAMPGMANTMAVPVQRHMMQTDHLSWDAEFQSQESLLNASTSITVEALPEQVPQDDVQKPVVPNDEMARLAAQVMDSVRHEQNPKFQKSEFMNLMRQLRDGEVVVDQDKIVPKESISASASATMASVDVKGKGRAVDVPPLVQVTMNQDVAGPSLSHHSRDSEELNAAYVPQARDDPHEAYFRQENADFTEYWCSHHLGLEEDTASPAQGNSWHEMQNDWDAFEATTTGVKQLPNYQFQTNNPYLLGDSSRTHNHALHMTPSQRVYESVLELEAAVQRDPTNAAAWYELGVKQQENEREPQAIQALERSVDLDPSLLPASLALSVSYTNEGNRLSAYDAIREWALQNPRYRDVVSNTSLASNPRGDFARLTDVLINMARHSDQTGGVDADVQVALAVLLTLTEDYAKAVDCFLTALAVRPEDWLLYNRVGATMANHGRAAEALEYYHRALDLNPAYIRARFNLGISCVNLRQYEEAATHIIDALVLQESDGVEDEMGMNDKRGVMSSTLWESLKTTCLHLQRVDLASMCDRRDLEGFRKVFYGV